MTAKGEKTEKNGKKFVMKTELRKTVDKRMGKKNIRHPRASH